MQKEEVINELKDEASSLMEEVVERDNMLKQYLKETDSEGT